ncbi:hypothetical protein [Deinococcus xinjiangensis]|uniref:hypothetical protein n=1 Tax=Deinococcus xinjiangensis TaxID=457454 RepID=UPI0033653E37
MSEQLGLPTAERPAGVLRSTDTVLLAYYRDSLPAGAERDAVQRVLIGQPLIPAEDLHYVMARLSPLIDARGLTDLGWIQGASLMSRIRQMATI